MQQNTAQVVTPCLAVYSVNIHINNTSSLTYSYTVGRYFYKINNYRLLVPVELVILQ